MEIRTPNTFTEWPQPTSPQHIRDATLLSIDKTEEEGTYFTDAKAIKMKNTILLSTIRISIKRQKHGDLL